LITIKAEVTLYHARGPVSQPEVIICLNYKITYIRIFYSEKLFSPLSKNSVQLVSRQGNQ